MSNSPPFPEAAGPSGSLEGQYRWQQPHARSPHVDVIGQWSRGAIESRATSAARVGVALTGTQAGCFPDGTPRPAQGVYTGGSAPWAHAAAEPNDNESLPNGEYLASYGSLADGRFSLPLDLPGRGWLEEFLRKFVDPLFTDWWLERDPEGRWRLLRAIIGILFAYIRVYADWRLKPEWWADLEGEKGWKSDVLNNEFIQDSCERLIGGAANWDKSSRPIERFLAKTYELISCQIDPDEWLSGIWDEIRRWPALSGHPPARERFREMQKIVRMHRNARMGR